jgi:hypothetical protein
VAAQLLRCQPAGDEWAFEHLVAAARLAFARGAADAAATYLRRALDEPPPPERRPEILLDLAAADSMATDPDSAIAALREVLRYDLDDERRFRATMLLAGLLGQTGRVADAVDVLERQLEAFADRADLQATAEAALVNVTRIDMATRARAKPVIERLRRRVASGEERDPAVLGTITAEMGMEAEPAAPMADLAERALDGSTSRSAPRRAGRATTPCARSSSPSATKGRCASSTRPWPRRAGAGRCSTSAPPSRSAARRTSTWAISQRPRSTRGACARSRTCAAGRWAPGSRTPGSARC